MRPLTWIGRRWKRLLLANVVGMAVQGVLLALLLWLGAGALVSLVTAKTASWGLFLAQMARA